ncbi:MAG: hypothetical protein KC635_00785, partial [Myxococcales bacterium]|nr:hypothetical protein [Myxococcales bacterium]
SPAFGVFPYDEVLFQDRIPAGTSLISASLSFTPSEFTRYSCQLPAGVTDPISVADFHDYVTDGACVPAFDPDATHIMFYAPQWGDAADGITAFRADFYTYVPAGYVPPGAVEPFPIQNTAYMDADKPASSGGAHVSASYTAARDLYTTSRPQSWRWDAQTTSPAVVIAGEEASVGFGLYRHSQFRPARNPRISVTVPDGVTILSAQISFLTTGGCADDPPPTTWTEPVLGSNPLVWQLGDDDEPYDMVDTGNVCTRVKLTWVASESYGFVNGDTVQFREVVSADNAGSYTHATSYNFTIRRPAEMKVGVEPGCYDNKAPAFVITASNTGGTDLEDVVVETAIPGTADGVSTAESTFAGLGLTPPDATFEYLVAGSWVATYTTAADVEAVRMHVAGIPTGGDPVQFEVR